MHCRPWWRWQNHPSYRQAAYPHRSVSDILSSRMDSCTGGAAPGSSAGSVCCTTATSSGDCRAASDTGHQVRHPEGEAGSPELAGLPMLPDPGALPAPVTEPPLFSAAKLLPPPAEDSAAAASASTPAQPKSLLQLLAELLARLASPPPGLQAATANTASSPASGLPAAPALDPAASISCSAREPARSSRSTDTGGLPSGGLEGRCSAVTGGGLAVM